MVVGSVGRQGALARRILVRRPLPALQLQLGTPLAQLLLVGRSLCQARLKVGSRLQLLENAC